MKKNLIPTAVFSLALLMAACGGKSAKQVQSDATALDSVVVDTTVQLAPADKNSPTCHVSINLKYATGMEAQTINDTLLATGVLNSGNFKAPAYKGDVKKAVADFVARFIDQYKKDCLSVYNEDKTSMSCNYEFFIKTSVLPGREDVLPYVAEKYLYMGGANGIASKFVRNFDVKTGKVIARADVVPADKEKVVTQLIVANLQKTAGVKSLEELKGLGYFMETDPYIPQTFILGPDSITFVYNEMEMAPHALGEIDAKVAYKDLEKK